MLWGYNIDINQNSVCDNIDSVTAILAAGINPK